MLKQQHQGLHSIQPTIHQQVGVHAFKQDKLIKLLLSDAPTTILDLGIKILARGNLRGKANGWKAMGYVYVCFFKCIFFGPISYHMILVRGYKRYLRFLIGISINMIGNLIMPFL
jgi:hypothetical protein